MSEVPKECVEILRAARSLLVEHHWRLGPKPCLTEGSVYRVTPDDNFAHANCQIPPQSAFSCRWTIPSRSSITGWTCHTKTITLTDIENHCIVLHWDREHVIPTMCIHQIGKGYSWHRAVLLITTHRCHTYRCHGCLVGWWLLAWRGRHVRISIHDWCIALWLLVGERNRHGDV